MAIVFQSGDIAFNLKERNRHRQWLQKVATSHKKKIGELNYLFADDSYTLQLNRQYLSHDTLTDIITFDSSAGQQVNGDIVISIERVRENAGKFGQDFESELRRVMVHGLLHLCGYKDKSKDEKAKMRVLEEKAMTLY